MVVISKHLFDSKLKDLSCHEVFHGWHPSCFKAGCIFANEIRNGVIIYFIIMYGAQYLLQRKKLTINDIKQIIRDYIISVGFTHIFMTSAFALLCLQRNLLGNFNYYLTAFGTGALVGSTGFMSPKSRFPVEATYFSMAALECIIKYLVVIRLLPRNKYAATPLFMVCNALMMLLLWKKQNTNKSINITWIFKPFCSKELSNNKICSHKGSCIQDFLKVTSKYFLIGGGISLIKLLATCIKKKELNIFKFVNKSQLKYPIFFGSYVGIYKAIHCMLTQKRGRDSQEHPLVAGFFSGIIYLMNPNLSLVTSLTVLITKAIFKEMKKSNPIPKLPYEYLSFVISTTIMFHFGFVNPKILPVSVMNMIKIISRGRSQMFTDRLDSLILSE